MSRLCDFLNGEHERIKSVEAEALALLDKGDSEGYRRKMKEKAEMLAALYDNSQALLAEEPENVRKQAAARIKNFSGSARTSLALDSVFYMSALLYPDDHRPGEPDNLELFIAQLKTS